MLNQTCIPGISSIRSGHIILLIYCWIWLAKILFRFFTPMFVSSIVLQFPCNVFVWFWYPSKAGTKVFGKHSLHFKYFWKVYAELILFLAIVFSTIHSETAWTQSFLWEKIFLTIVSISLIHIGLFRLSLIFFCFLRD